MTSQPDLRGARVLDDESASPLPLRDDTAEFVRTLRMRAEGKDQISRTVCDAFDFDSPVTVTRAPGRLDFMGGIADYSGSLVLQMPIAEACHVAAQARQGRQGGRLTIISPRRDHPSESSDGDHHRAETFTCAMDDLLRLTYDDAREMFAKDPNTKWAAYIAGTLLVLATEKRVKFDKRDVTIYVGSDVPEGKGVSSSAAVEVAAMYALAVLSNVQFVGDEGGRELAMLCQLCENRVAGAPCGVMDQMTSSLGRENHFLALLCRPAEVTGHVRVPRGMKIVGIDSGVRHSNDGGSDYGLVRCAAFMCRALINESWPELGIKHLTDLEPHWFEAQLVNGGVPGSTTGTDFLASHPGGHGDDVTAIDQSKTYATGACGGHPVREHRRVTLVRDWLMGCTETSPMDTPVLSQVGAFMYQSHRSYGDCGLGSHGTDRLVDLCEGKGKARGVFGAKVTGGGSGGTVCVLTNTDDDAAAAVKEVCEEYGGDPTVFVGSSPGAMAFGHLSVVVGNP